MFIPSTSHSLNPVPFCLVDPQLEWSLIGNDGESLGGLAQIGGTILELCREEIWKIGICFSSSFEALTWMVFH